MKFSEACGVFTRKQIKSLRERARLVWPGDRAHQKKWMRARLLCSPVPKVNISFAASSPERFERQSGIPMGTKFGLSRHVQQFVERK